VTGLPQGTTAFFDPASITASGQTTLTIANLNPGEYTAAVVGTDTNTGQTQSLSIAIVVQSPAGALPAGWNNLDVNSSPSGSVGFGGEVFSIQGGGELGMDYYTQDTFHFAFTPLQGDGSIVARVVDKQDASYSTTQAGIMIRDGLDSDGSNVLLSVGYDGYIDLQYRSGVGASGTFGAYGSSNSRPQWLKLTRQGDVVTAFVSSDGVSWTEVGSPLSIGMSANVYAGLAVSSNNPKSTGSAIFDNVFVNSNNAAAGFSVSSASSNVPLLGIPGSTVPSVILQTGAPGFADTVTYSVTGLPTGVSASFSLASLVGSGKTTLTLALPLGVSGGAYPLTVTATDTASGQTQTVTITLDIQDPSGALPPGWVSLDINSTPLGNSGFSGGVFTVQGGGEAGIDDRGPDGFQFAFTSIQGDGSIIARPVLIQDEEGSAQAGVMIRDGVDPDANNVFLYFDQFGTVNLAHRSGPDGESNDADTGGLPPNWLKLVRQGNTFTGYISIDGVTWSEVGILSRCNKSIHNSCSWECGYRQDCPNSFEWVF
jgi:hypothetical protein